MNGQRMRIKRRQSFWKRRLRFAVTLSLISLGAVSTGCEREVRVSALTQDAQSNTGTIPAIPASVQGVDPTRDPSPTLPSGSSDRSSSLSGTYTLQRYQCVGDDGSPVPLYMAGSLGTQSETLLFSGGHLRDVVGYSQGCTVILDYDLVYASDSEMKLTNRQYSILYFEAPDTDTKCGAATPKSARASDYFTFPYLYTDQKLILMLKDNSTNPFCGSNESLQSVYVKD